MLHDEMKEKVAGAIGGARDEGFLDEHEVPPLLAWLDRAHGALTADPTDMPKGSERTKALRQMLIDTMSAVEQTDDEERMHAAIDAFDAKGQEIEASERRIVEVAKAEAAAGPKVTVYPSPDVAGMATDDRPSIAELMEQCRLIAEGKLAGSDAIQDAAPVLLEIAVAALAEDAAECTTQTWHWDYVECGCEDSLCFKDIHCPSCPVSVARAKVDATLARVRP